MKITRSTKCSLRFATDRKKEQWRLFLIEYVRVVNLFIDHFWFDMPENNNKLVKAVLNIIDKTWLTQRAKACAARQALGMVKAVRTSHVEKRKEKQRCKSTPRKPVLRKLKADLSSLCATLETPEQVSSFDAWLHLNSLGNKISLDIPIKFHKHYSELAEIGKRCTQFIITNKYIQIPFEIEVEQKLPPTGCIGIDTGINALASISIGEQFGTEIKNKIERVKRCQHGSKGQQRARRSLRQYIDSTVNEIMSIENLTLVVVEQLKNITKNTTQPKRRLGKNIRRSIGAWNVAYWLKRLEMACERNRVSFRTVTSFYTSQTCPVCGHCHRENRNGLVFKCLSCGYTDNADISASKSILNRHLNGKFGKDCIRLADR
jgi:transposase